MTLESIPLCFFHYITGWDCPGCGLTRACFQLIHGDFYRAIQFNALAPVVLLIGLLYLAENLYWLKSGSRPQWFTPLGNKWISRSFGLLFFGQWIFKSLLHLDKVLSNKNIYSLIS